MVQRVRSAVVAGVVTFLCGVAVSVAQAHICDNVFREPDKLVVKPEITNIIVKESIRFKLFLQNNMDRGIDQIRVGGQSPAFEVRVAPEKRSVPAGARVFFDVELRTVPDMPSGTYPLDFRLYAVKGQAQQEYKRFRMGVVPAYVVPRAVETGPAEQAEEDGEQELARLIEADGKATEPSWREALVISNFRSTEGKPADPQTVVLVVFDSEALYFAFACLGPEPGSAGARDSVSVRFSPQGSEELYSVTVAGDGALQMSARKDSEVRDLATETVGLGMDRSEAEWFAEMSLPWAVFGMKGPPEPGETWRLNIVRQRTVDGLQRSFWAGSPGTFQELDSYGHLFFAPQP